MQGAAQATAAVTVNGTSAERLGDFIRRELTARQLFATFAASREAVPDRKDRTRRREKGGWSLAKDTWNSAFGSAELKPVFDSAFTAFPDYQWVKNHSSALGTTFSGFARRDFAKRLRQGDSGSP